ncbi:MAG: PAC2 family protein [Candidatus Thermoplasmatota archaeon]|nr:PAC2 family protein [Candidatus Thermoplasmatota archaeon]
MEDKVALHEYRDKDIGNALVVTGFPTVGFVGTIATRFIVNQLDLDLIGAFLSDYFHPATVISKGVPAPPVRIYAGDKPCGLSEECDQIIVISSEFFPPPPIMRPLATHILRWCEARDCRSLVAIEGFNASDDQTPIYGVASAERGRQFLKKHDIKLMQEGMVSGISGILLYEGEISHFDTLCLLAGTQTKFPDAAAAARLLEVVNVMLPDIDIDPEPLYKESERIEQELKKHLQESQPTQVGAQTSPMYG